MRPNTYIFFSWILALVVWGIGAFTAKRTARRQSISSRAIDLAAAGVAALLLFEKNLRLGPLARRFVPQTQAVLWTGAALTMIGIGFAIAARFFLGGNWSAAVTIKEGHQLVRRGAYGLVRHPIYLGFLVALFGTALAIAEIRALMALTLVAAILVHKITVEEGFMLEQFGLEYVQYRKQVKALIPFVW